MKSFVKITMAVLAVGMAATLAGCDGCMGCSTSANNNTLTNSNWYTGTSYKGIQRSFIVGENSEYTKEVIEYGLNFEKGSNSSYSVDYKDGSLTTEFYATYYDWSTSHYPEDSKELVYYYKNEMTLSVQYKKGDNSSEWFADSVVNESYFRAAGKELKPIYSKQVVKSTTPNNYQAGSVDGAYKKVEAVYENFYNKTCTEVTSYKTEDGKTTEAVYGNLHKTEYTLFDNSSLYIAVRSMKLSDGLSQTISLFGAASGGVANYNIAGNKDGIPEEQLNAISAELQENKLFTPTEEKKTIPTVGVNINYAGGELTGTTQKVWYAAIENYDNNTARATMLKLEIPLSYNLGTLSFTLKDIKSNIWNK